MDIIDLANAHRSTGICFHLRDVDFSDTSLSTAADIMIAHINRVLIDLNLKKEIEEFIIGKTHTRLKNNHNFPDNDVDCWNLSEIRSAWRRFRDAGFHNLIVLSIVDESCAPSMNPLWPNNEAEELNIALEQSLIYCYQNKDVKLGNQIFEEGLRNVESNHGVLFIAIKYKEQMEDQSIVRRVLLWCCGIILSFVFGVIEMMRFFLR